MTSFENSSINTVEEKKQNISSPERHHMSPGVNGNDRLTELEVENSRLHRLVAELLIKNQQLRKPD